MTKVLVTGATGFLASHLILQLIDHGYDVRGTVRSLEKGNRLQQALSDYAGQPISIEFVLADLNSDDGWAAAVDARPGQGAPTRSALGLRLAPRNTRNSATQSGKICCPGWTGWCARRSIAALRPDGPF